MKVYIQPLNFKEDFKNGSWFDTPVNIEWVCEVLGIQTDEDYFISDCDLFDLKEETTLQQINILALKYVLEVEGTPFEKELKNIKNQWFVSYEEMFELLECVKWYECASLKEVAYELLESQDSEVALHIPVEYRRYFDYEKYVSELEQSGKFLVTPNGVFQLNLSKSSSIIESKIQEGQRTRNWDWLKIYERLQSH